MHYASLTALYGKIKQADLVGLRQVPQQVQGIHQIHHGLGNLRPLPEIILGKERAVLGRFHNGIRGFFTQAVNAA